MKNKIIAVDFDGTLCENAYPSIGAPRRDVIEKLIKEQQEGATVILWTCRRGQGLLAAIYWSLEQGIAYDYINENVPEIVKKFDGDSRKIYADEYWDDRAAVFTERDAAFADNKNNILKIVTARIHAHKECAERLGAFNYDGVVAKIRQDEASRIFCLINSIL